MAADATFFAPFMDDYFAESSEHLTEIRRLLLELGQAPSPAALPAMLEELFRHFHSVKGISGMVQLREAEMLAHHMESYLRALRQNAVVLDSPGLDALIDGTDALERTIEARRAGAPQPPVDVPIAQLARVSNGDGTPARPSVPVAEPVTRARWRISFTPSAQSVARGVTVDTVRQRLREAAEIVDVTPRVLAGGLTFEFLVRGALSDATAQAWRDDGLTIEPAGPDTTDAREASAAADANARLALAHVVRVDLTRLDALMQMIGDLVISRARLGSALERVERYIPPMEWRTVQENTLTLERQLRDLRDGVMRVRLVRVAEIFRRMPLVVRDLAREMRKDVQLVLHGQDTEIDKFVVERMMDPVLHLVRNALSHGFERPEERIASGKPPQGTLTLSAASVGESVVLEIIDDGRGVDTAAVVARARELGLAVPDGDLDGDAVLALICSPGFSTRGETDRASGRGVGMAVVRTTVQELNGRLSLTSVPGEGSRFVIELPVTLSITDALIAHVGDRVFAVPQHTVREVFDVEPSRIRAIERNEIVPYRGSSLPIVRLANRFAILAHPRRTLHVLVHGTGTDAVGIAVDRVSGQREIVVRAIQDELARVDGVSGATDLGDGRVVLILDIAAIARGDGHTKPHGGMVAR